MIYGFPFARFDRRSYFWIELTRNDPNRCGEEDITCNRAGWLWEDPKTTYNSTHMQQWAPGHPEPRDTDDVASGTKWYGTVGGPSNLREYSYVCEKGKWSLISR